MKTFLSLFLVLFFSVSAFNVNASTYCSTNSTISFTGGEEENLSVMVVNVKKVKKEKNAEAIKAELMNVKGIKKVNTCSESGTVKISYSKAELGCCSKIHNTLKAGNWKYSMVSNKANPACTKGASSCHKGAKSSGQGCSHAKKAKGA